VIDPRIFLGALAPSAIGMIAYMQRWRRPELQAPIVFDWADAPADFATHRAWFERCGLDFDLPETLPGLP
jgi:hypothetical protein